MPQAANSSHTAALGPGQVHLWLVDLDAAGAPPDGLLSAPESERAARMRAAVDGRRWAAARWALRELLGRYLQQQPATVELALEEQGKPRLATTPPPLEFNLSHSRDRALLALAPAGHPVGVDIERVDAGRDFPALARRVLDAADAEAIASTSPELRADAFYAAWTAHEARLKCGGGGFGGPPPSDRLTVRPVAVGEGFAAAFAVAGLADPRASLYRLDLR
jgi:4'-phosphopantetheinyl transferase